MDSKMGTAASDTNNFEPTSDLIQEDECDTLLLYLPGFTKEQLRVQLTRSRVLKIGGTRPLGNNKFSSFQKDFTVSGNCDVNKITAKFEDGILYVRQPKLIVPAAEKADEKTTPPLESPQPQKPAEQPPAPPKTDQERQPTPTKAKPSDDDRAKDLAEKKEETPSKEKERVREPEGGKKDGTIKYGGPRPKGVHDDKKKKAAAARAGSDKLARLKTASENMTKMLILLLIVALGMYLGGKLPWFSRKVED